MNSSQPHDSAHLHVAGESLYIDDRPFLPNELHVGLFTSTHAKALIKQIDVSAALEIPDVVCIILAHDIAHNHWGSIVCEQPFLAENQVNYVGEVIAVIGARTKEAIKNAQSAIKIEYEILPACLSISDAIKQQSFIGDKKIIARGDAQKNLSTAAHRLSGELVIHGADHFYLENQAAIAYPGENNTFEIHSSTQHPTETQTLVAEALDIPLNAVVCIATRLGGGFGGKETQAAPFAVYAALVAHKTKCPARLVLSKDDDMQLTGKRNPYQIFYDVGFDATGKIIALHARFFGDGGAYADLSPSILERALFHADNAYFIPHAHFEGQVCRTNFHSHTAFRGFGGPKGVAMIEHVMEEIAHYLQCDALDVRKLNCYQGADIITPYGQEVKNNLLPQLFAKLEATCDYRKRRQQIEKWNQNSNHNPRGLSLTAIKFGISFTTRFLNQAHALVHIFRDGSVQVVTGGVEMGQGVHARIKALVAEEFGISPTQVRIMPTATDKSANTSPTAASSGTDLNGAAAVNAAQKIKQRLSSVALELIKRDIKEWPQNTAALATSPEIEADAWSDEVIFRDGHAFTKSSSKKIDFTTLVNNAYLSRIALSDYGFFKTPHLCFNKILGQGDAFLYFTQGVAASEVEIDRFSGDVKVLRTDILMDLGIPINEALDCGQIAGGFIQGMGWVTNEILFYNPDGVLLSHSPSTYKIPSIHDIPRHFHIDLMDNPHNTVNLYGTKAVGEPPLMLCFSVWNAIKNALSYRTKAPQFLSLPIPAHKEAIMRVLVPDLFISFEQD